MGGKIAEAIGREEALIHERVQDHQNPTGGSLIRNYTDGRRFVLRERRTTEAGVVLTFSDITDIRRAEEALEAKQSELLQQVDRFQEKEPRLQQHSQELEALNAELQVARDLAESANRAKSAFLANMSHEIRTPLSAIAGFLQLLSVGDLNEDQRQMVQSANLAASALKDIIGEVLDISKIEAETHELELRNVDIRELVGEIATIMSARVDTRSIRLITQISHALPAIVRIDPLRVKQCLMNLVGNAVKFTDQGAIHLSLSLRHQEGQLFLRADVSDTGLGFETEAAGELFEEFTKADPTITRRFGGTGLGLAICRHMINAMGGSIGCEGKSGRGAWFWFEFPLRQLPDARPHPIPPSDIHGHIVVAGLDTEPCQEIAARLVEAGARPQLADQMVEPLTHTSERSTFIWVAGRSVEPAILATLPSRHTGAVNILICQAHDFAWRNA
jgi:signal transduction histidine kinase